MPFYRLAQVKGFLVTFADADGTYRNGCLTYWSFIFYLSKYYELLDSAILIAKGKRISLLQAYHHAGVILVMWSFASTGTASSVCLVAANACVHTVMYIYYMMAALKIRMPFKNMITVLQIVQFCVGQVLATTYLIIAERNPGVPPPQDVWASTFGLQTVWMSELTSTLFGQAYVFPLIVLFTMFYIKTYSTAAAPVSGSRRVKRD